MTLMTIPVESYSTMLICLVNDCTLLYIIHNHFFYYPNFHMLLHYVDVSVSESGRIKTNRCLFLEIINHNGNYNT